MQNRFGYEYQLTLKMFLEHGVQFSPKQKIVYGEIMEYSYLDQYKRVKKLSNVLKTLGVKKQETIGMLEWDTHRFMEAHWAVPISGFLFHTVNVRMPPAQIAYCIDHAEDKIVFFNEEFLPIIENISGLLTKVEKYIIMTDREDFKMPETTMKNLYEYEELLEGASDEFDFPEISENTPATLCYTSGTTGNPKGVIFTHRELVMHSIATGFQTGLYKDQMDSKSDSVYMPLTPMFHVQAWTSPYLFYMLGCKYVLPGKFEPLKILRLIHKEKVNIACCVSTILHMLIFRKDIENFNLKGLNVCVGGAKLTQQIAMKCLKLGIHAISYYGMTETGPGIASGQVRPEFYDLSEEDKYSYYVRAGLPWPWCKIKIVNEDFMEVSQGCIGEIVVRSPWASHEYYKEPEMTATLWKNGWLHTEDLG